MAGPLSTHSHLSARNCRDSNKRFNNTITEHKPGANSGHPAGPPTWRAAGSQLLGWLITLAEIGGSVSRRSKYRFYLNFTFLIYTFFAEESNLV